MPATDRQTDAWENPMGTDGIAFIEFSSPDPQAMAALFGKLGFHAVARHRSKAVTLFRQGGVNFLLNDEPGSHAARFAADHGPCACAMAFRVGDAADAFRRVVERGATPVTGQVGPLASSVPVIEGIGGMAIYLVDETGGPDILDIDFRPIDGVDQNPKGLGLTAIDHLTHNVARGNMDKWSDFYERLFGFREIAYFEVEGKITGVRSRAMASPCDKIRIPINESTDDTSQIVEFLERYRGEGIQHIALNSDDIHTTVGAMRAAGIPFMDMPDTYYEQLDARIPGHGEDLQRLRENQILIDGRPNEGHGQLLQIFTDTVVGPIFFEVIQRKGSEGFGEGNFEALFEAIELDQMRRGVLPDFGETAE